jgi:YfiH family protein
MRFLQSRLLAEAGVAHGFSVRTGGVSVAPYDSLNVGAAVGDDPEAVRANKRLLLETAGVLPSLLSTVNQVHGDRVVFARMQGDVPMVTSETNGAGLEGRVDADALVAHPGAAVGVRTADCVPILVFDPQSRAAAAVHAGWRGTVAGIVNRAVDALVESFGARRESLIAAIGPSIGRCCFEVGDDLAERFTSDERFGAEVLFRHGASGKPTVDLFHSNRLLLNRAGLRAEHIELLERCTSCERDLFFSHRRDAGQTGRHLAFILAG